MDGPGSTGDSDAGVLASGEQSSTSSSTYQNPVKIAVELEAHIFVKVIEPQASNPNVSMPSSHPDE